MLTKLSFELKFSFSNGAMRVIISDDNSTLLDLIDISEPMVQRSINITLPTKLTFTLSGKGKYDTQLDSNNNIIADKYVLLSAMKLGEIPIQSNKLFDICDYTTSDGHSKNTFWAFDGQVIIDFDEKDFIKWHLKNNNIFDFEPTHLSYV